MSQAAERKRCVVAYAAPGRQHLWSVELAPGADVAQALAAARQLAGAEGAGIPWDAAPVGIFGEACARTAVPREGDRIEIYRPLAQDPRASRRERTVRTRAATRRVR